VTKLHLRQNSWRFLKVTGAFVFFDEICICICIFWRGVFFVFLVAILLNMIQISNEHFNSLFQIITPIIPKRPIYDKKKIQKGIRIYPSTVSVPYRTVPCRFTRGTVLVDRTAYCTFVTVFRDFCLKARTLLRIECSRFAV
jgi:hypothetical protein